MLDKETRQLINKARTLGSTGLSVFLEDDELLRICALAAVDLEQQQLVDNIATDAELAKKGLLRDASRVVPAANFPKSAF